MRQNKGYIDKNLVNGLKPTERLSWPISVPVTREGALTLYDLSRSKIQKAVLHFARFENDFAVAIVSREPFFGITTHYERPVINTPFYVLRVARINDPDDLPLVQLRNPDSIHAVELFPEEALHAAFKVAEITNQALRGSAGLPQD